jgi:C-terminal processing protease CtpA/Prc
VLRIGDRDVSEAYAAVRQMVGRDNEQGARYWAQYLLAMPEVLHAFRITRTLDEVPLTLMTEHGQQVITLRVFEPVEIMSGDKVAQFNHRPGWIDVRDFSAKPDPPWLRAAPDAFHFERLGSLLYVQINTIADTPAESLAHFAGRLRDEIAATKPERVAIDLRLNRGGNAMLNPPLIRALIQSAPIDREDRLFVIIGPATFSAAQMLADALEQYTNVTFVGEPSGSKGNAYGDSRKIALPNSGMTVRASIYYWQDWHPMDTRDAIVPQIPAPLTMDDYRNNIDPAIVAIEGVLLARP